MSDTPLPDPLEDFLAQPPAGPRPDALRRDLLGRTSAIVRRRRWVRRAVGAALAAAVVLAAVVLWHFRAGGEGPVPAPRTEFIARTGPGRPPPAEGPPAPAAPAVALEWEAFDAPRPRKAALYLKAGNRYIEEDHDVESALRCYGQAVQTADARELQIEPDDNWLVRALKREQAERRKEH